MMPEDFATPATAGLDVGMLTLGRQRLRVGVRAPRNGEPPLLLFNGIGGNIELFAPLMSALDPNVGIITFDMPGVGHSATPSRPYRPHHMANLTCRVLEHLGYAQVDVLGTSWGGIVAQEFARRHASACRRLILAATTTGVVMVPARPLAMVGMALPRRGVVSDLLRRPLVGLWGATWGGDFRRDPTLGQRYLRHIRWQSTLGQVLQLLALTGWTSVHWLHRLTQPVLVMCGDDDPITRPLNARLQHALLRDARLWRVDCGHLFLISRAAPAARAIENFLYQRDIEHD